MRSRYFAKICSCALAHLQNYVHLAYFLLRAIVIFRHIHENHLLNENDFV